MDEKIDSHIQMPKGILKKFVDKNHKIYCYDVITKKIHQRTPSSCNTEVDWYDVNMEKELNKKIEDPFLKTVTYLERHIDKIPLVITGKNINDIKNYFNALFARSPKMYEEAKKGFFWPNFHTEQTNHELAVSVGIDEMEKRGLFDEFKIFFIKNQTEIPFVLPIMGMYSYTIEETGERKIILPITPKLAIALIDNNFVAKYTGADNLSAIWIIEKEESVNMYNRYALVQQCKLKYGCVVSSTRKQLEEIIKVVREKIHFDC